MIVLVVLDKRERLYMPSSYDQNGHVEWPERNDAVLFFLSYLLECARDVRQLAAKSVTDTH